jgi:hypothetical protein
MYVGEGEENRDARDLQGHRSLQARSSEIPRVAIKKTNEYQMDEQNGRIHDTEFIR